MGGQGKGDNSIQAFFSPAPSSSPAKSITPSNPSSDATIGDGFTAEEVQGALRPKPAEAWHPSTEYTELEIRHLEPGPKAVTFMGRVANIFDVANTPKTPRSAKGCIKLCVKDDKAAITVSEVYSNDVSRFLLNMKTGPSLVLKEVTQCTSWCSSIGMDNAQ